MNNQLSIHFVLEALKDEVALRILELSDLLLLLQLVVFHRGADIVGVSRVLRMEHVSAEIQNRFLIDALLVGLANLQLGELLDELRDSVDEIGRVHCTR